MCHSLVSDRLRFSTLVVTGLGLARWYRRRTELGREQFGEHRAFVFEQRG
jgi:hypothetical protein